MAIPIEIRLREKNHYAATKVPAGSAFARSDLRVCEKSGLAGDGVRADEYHLHVFDDQRFKSVVADLKRSSEAPA